jgi:hypothetical protein
MQMGRPDLPTLRCVSRTQLNQFPDNKNINLITITLKMGALCSSDILVTTYETNRRHNQITILTSIAVKSSNVNGKDGRPIRKHLVSHPTYHISETSSLTS